MSPLPRPCSPNPDNERARGLSPESGTDSSKATHAPFGDLGGKRTSPTRGDTREAGQAGGRAGPPPPRGGAATTFPTPERLALPGISLAPGLLTSPRQPGIKAVLPTAGATESARPALAPALQPPAPPPRLSELSPMARAAAAPRALRLLGAALLLLLLLPAGRRAAGAPVAAELRCQCLQTVQGIHLKNIQNVMVTPSGPHCDQTEVIATLKNGQEVCLNPEAPMVKRLINKMLNKASTN